MKLILAAVAASLSIATLAPGDASAGERGLRRVVSEKHTGARFYGRAHSVQANGLCKRDTGTSNDELNFRNKCDVEEYWARVFENGRRR